MTELDSQIIKAQVMAALFGDVREPPRIGRFAVIKREAAGSMGEVYVAYDEELDRKVAVKLLRTELSPQSDSDAGRHRLLREARTLAGMPHHRNLVQVYEAGLHGSRVFLAMEYIRGRTLREWLAARRDAAPNRRSRAADWRAVLAAVLDAGRGLEAAHSAGVVHRDFKPDNVVVGDDGRVCVVDFGLARPLPSSQEAHGRAATDGSPRSATGEAGARPPNATTIGDETATGEVAGTPAYMAPEQLSGEPGDARSDQFSFCVVLHEALYGVRPFDGADLAGLHASILAGLRAAPARDSAVPRYVGKALERGLAVDPADRYDSMRALLAALLRDPARRFRRIAVAALLLGAGTVVGGLSYRAAQSSPDPCALAGSAVASIWNPAVADRVDAAFAASGLGFARSTWQRIRPGLDRYAAALAEDRKAACVSHVGRERSDDLFERRMICLARRERHLQAVAAELVAADPSTVNNAAASVASLPAIETCRDDEVLLAGVAVPEDPGAAAAVGAIRAQLARAHARRVSGHPRDARDLAEAALGAARSVGHPPVLAAALHEAGAAWRAGATPADVARAEDALREAADLAESQRSDELLNEIWLELVRLIDNRPGDKAIARHYAQRALATSARLHNERSRMVGLGLLGSLSYREGDYEAAEGWEQQALALALAPATGASRLELADVWNQLGYIRGARERFEDARAAYEQAIALSRAELGPDHPRLAALSFNFAMLCRQVSDLPRARALYQAAVNIWIDALGRRNLNVAAGYLDLSLVEIEAGDLDQAAAYAELARAILTEIAPDRPELASVEIRLGLVAFRRGQLEPALHAFERGLAIRERTRASPVQIAVAASNVAEALVELGHPGVAAARIAQLERGPDGAAGSLPTVRAVLDKVAGLALLARGDRRAALSRLERALAVLEREPGVSLEEADVKWAVARALPPRDPRACALAGAARARYLQLGEVGARPSEAIARWQTSASCPKP